MKLYYYLKVAAAIFRKSFINSNFKFIAPGLYKNEKSSFALFDFYTNTFFIWRHVSLLFSDAISYKVFLSFETIGSNTSLPIQLEVKLMNTYHL